MTLKRKDGIAVTTSHEPADSLVSRAKDWAKENGLHYVSRNRQAFDSLRERYGVKTFWLITGKGLRYIDESNEEMFFHPSTALVRLKRLAKGEQDVLLQLADVRCGDHVLDCTAGLGSDALVFAHAVGSDGLVTALESQYVPFTLLTDGMWHYHAELPELRAALQRVNVFFREHYNYLCEQADNSVDIVYFDPMFRRPIEEASAMVPLRDLANDAPLTAATIEQAKRVARRKVVLKDHRESREFERLGFSKQTRSHTKIAYGVIEC